MFERLIDLAVSAWSAICPVTVVDQWEAGVILRAGRERRTLRVGVVWLVPLLEQALRVDTRRTTEGTKPQTVTAADGRTWTFTLAATWRVADAREYLLNVYDGENVVLDSLLGAAAHVIATWDGESSTESLTRRIKTSANRAARGWGVKFDKLQFSDLAQSATYRVFRCESE